MHYCFTVDFDTKAKYKADTYITFTCNFVFRQDTRGRVKQIVYADHSRACRLDCELEVSSKVFGALRKFNNTLNSEDSIVKYRLNDGMSHYLWMYFE